MQIQVSVENDISILNVSGRVDAVTTADFEVAGKNVLEDGAKKVLLNFEEVEYISSAGLRSILILLKLANAQSAKIAYFNVQTMVAEVFKISGFAGMLSIYESKDEALAAINA